MEFIEKRIEIENVEPILLFGYHNNLLNILENRFASSILSRGNMLIIKGEGEEVKIIDNVIKELIYLIEKNKELTEKDVNTVVDLLTAHNHIAKSSKKEDNSRVIYHGYKDTIYAKTQRQMEYYQKVLKNDLVFSIGPAGTGKTFLAVAMALDALKRNEVSRIILSRPAVEAGESLGFLPGDMNEKIDPYLRPLTDALQSMISPDKLKSMKERNIIEINPLAYMRGRTLNNAFIILDEAQNATVTQMKMFLTRMGQNSKTIVTGDITQIDLPRKTMSGLRDAERILKGIEGIAFLHFEKEDVVRHKLVAQILNAYEKSENEYENQKVKIND